jgi:MFS family permease
VTHPTREWPTGGSAAAVVLLPFVAAFFLQELYRVTGAVVAPYLVRDFDLNARAIGLLTSVYFLTFALMQLPAGLLLDRFGPRRVLAALLGFGIAGATLFAAASEFAALAIGRALLGLGGSTCLMASFTAAALWCSRERLALVNGSILALGSLGGIVATLPVEWLMQAVHWRWIWGALAALTLLVILALLRAPERREPGAGPRGWSGYAAVFRTTLFWRIAPAVTLTQGTWLAYQGLWAGGWLSDIAGLGRETVAAHLLIVVAAAVPGYLIFGYAAERLQRIGISAQATFIGGQLLFLAAQLLIFLFPRHQTWLAWTAFGFLGTAGGLGFSILTQAGPLMLAGRTNSALNLLLFAGAFALQFGIGWIVGFWPRAADGSYPPVAHRTAFSLQFALQVCAIGWFFLSPSLARRTGR